MVKLIVRDRESIQEAVRRFRKLVERSGIKKEMRRREYYESPAKSSVGRDCAPNAERVPAPCGSRRCWPRTYGSTPSGVTRHFGFVTLSCRAPQPPWSFCLLRERLTHPG